jgi:hypothetical protein
METSVLTQLNRIVVKKTMFVGPVALVNLVPPLANVHQGNIAVMEHLP